MNTLPLSWCRSNKGYSGYEAVELNLSGITWIATAEVPLNYTKEDIYQDISARYPGFVLRGLSNDTARYFLDKGADVLHTGAEAVVDLDKADIFKRSVLDLAKRGLRHGVVKEVPNTGSYEEKLRQLTSESSHGKEPNLHHLYRCGFDMSVRCFVLTTSDDLWLGAVTISDCEQAYAHTESILRRSGAPVGVMEALFVSVMETLKEEGYNYFSLGEVPFVHGEQKGRLPESYINHMIYKTMPFLKHSFDYNGLYNFKNKFGPVWFPKYLAAKPGISKRLLIDLYFKSRFYDLTVYKLFDGIKKRFPIALKTQ